MLTQLWTEAAFATDESLQKSKIVEPQTSNQKASSKPKVWIEHTPPQVHYSTHVESVSNSKHYEPYKPPPVHTDSGLHRAPPHTLSGQIKEEQSKADDTGQMNDKLKLGDLFLNEAPALGSVKAGSVTGKSFRVFIQRHRGDQIFKSVQKESVIVVKGKWDHAEHILTECRIPHIELDARALPQKLGLARLVIVNCAGMVSDSVAHQLSDFVRHGGFLLTTDWALEGCLQAACPGFAYWDGAYSKAEIVDAIAVEPGDNLFDNCSRFAPWKLDDKSQLVQVSRKKSIEVLVRSRMLSKEDPANLGILALTFKFGKGRVLHLVGHFDNNTNVAFANALPDPSPQISISMRQAIALNFVMDALEEPRKEPVKNPEPEAPKSPQAESLKSLEPVTNR